ncbi:hypothetical protein BDZ45DRAFT_252598 [Acephala macrosclerotiorum]|nr:hypothetical protein BDZ45DRAFT_252598 [Acephala macrosclerotiorum]
MRKYHSDKRNNNHAPDEVGDAQQQVATTDRPSALPLRNPPRTETTPQQPQTGPSTSPERPYTQNPSYDSASVSYIVNRWCDGCYGRYKSRSPNHSSLGPEPSHVKQCTCMKLPIPFNLDPPFHNPFQVDSKQVLLLHFAINGVARTTVPLGLKSETEWFAQAMTDQAFFHGTILVGVTFNALLKRDTTFPPECFYHYSEAIKYTSASLENAESQLHEGTVAAVACLAAFETAVNFNTTSESVHIDGLEKVMSIRKARHQLVLSEYLQKLISWVDTCHAAANITRPRFLSVQSHKTMPANPTFEQEKAIHDCLDAEWDPEFPLTAIMFYEGMDVSTAKLFHRVRQLSALATRLDAMKLDPVFQRQFTEGMLLLERQVIASIWSMASNNRRQRTDTKAVRACARTWHSTILTYIHMFLRRTHRNSWRVVVDKVAARLRYSLKILTPTELWVDFPPKFLLWVLVIAGAATDGHPDRKWLAGLLSRLKGRQKLESWEEALPILKEYAWVDNLCSEPCRKFFEESIVGIIPEEDGRANTLFTTVVPPAALDMCMKDAAIPTTKATEAE